MGILLDNQNGVFLDDRKEESQKKKEDLVKIQ
jgi:hypothetical protein